MSSIIRPSNSERETSAYAAFNEQPMPPEAKRFTRREIVNGVETDVTADPGDVRCGAYITTPCIAFFYDGRSMAVPHAYSAADGLARANSCATGIAYANFYDPSVYFCIANGQLVCWA